MYNFFSHEKNNKKLNVFKKIIYFYGLKFMINGKNQF